MKFYITLEGDDGQKVERIVIVKRLGEGVDHFADMNELSFDMINTLDETNKPL